MKAGQNSWFAFIASNVLYHGHIGSEHGSEELKALSLPKIGNGRVALAVPLGCGLSPTNCDNDTTKSFKTYSCCVKAETVRYSGRLRAEGSEFTCLSTSYFDDNCLCQRTTPNLITSAKKSHGDV